MLFVCPDTNKSKKGKLYPAGSIEVEPSDGAAHEGTADGTKPEELNKKALQIIQRVRDKLTGGMRQGGGEGRGGKEKGDLDVAIVNCPHHMTCFLFLR